MSKHLEKYYEIMDRYRNGDFGNQHLTLFDILTAADAPDLIDKMTSEDLQILINNSTGLTKLMYQNFLERRKSTAEAHPYAVVSPSPTDLSVRRVCYQLKKTGKVRNPNIVFCVSSARKTIPSQSHFLRKKVFNSKVKK